MKKKKIIAGIITMIILATIGIGLIIWVDSSNNETPTTKQNYIIPEDDYFNTGLDGFIGSDAFGTGLF